MPRGFLRLLAVLLLTVTIPVQGIAAVTKAQCMSFGHHQHSEHQEHHDHGKAPAGPHCGPCGACCATVVTAASVFSAIVGPVSSPPCCASFPLASVSLDTPDRPPLVG
jgi:hypothetical protein